MEFGSLELSPILLNEKRVAEQSSAQVQSPEIRAVVEVING